jgi:hypothetical protein
VTIDRPERDQDGNWIYYASELGGCTKALIAKRMGKVQKITEPVGTGSDPGRLARIFSEGNLHEEVLADELKLHDRQRLLTFSFGVPGTVVHGHIDGCDWYGVVEIKTMGDASFKEFKRRLWDTPGLVQKYKWQLSLYQFILESWGTLIVKNRNDGELITLRQMTPFYNYDDFQNRILLIETAAEIGELPVECDFPNFPCPYQYLHEEVKVIRSDAEIDMLVNTYLDAKRTEAESAIRSGAARQLLLEALGDNDVLETVGGSRLVKYGSKDEPRIRITTRQEAPDETEP